MVRSLVTGLVLAVTAAVVALYGQVLGLTTVWPVLAAAAVGLLLGAPRWRHVIAVTVGAVLGVVGSALQVAVLPALPASRALAVAAIVVVAALLGAVTGGRLGIGTQLVGWSVVTALLEPQVAANPAGFLTYAPLTLAAALAAFGLGLLAALVATLLGGGAAQGDGPVGAHERARDASAVTALAALGATALLAAVVAPASALAGLGGGVEGDVTGVQHRQAILVPYSADGVRGDGLVITQLLVTGSGTATVTLEDQAVAGLRDATSFGGPAIAGTTVTHTLDLSTGRAFVRTVADLDRTPPVAFDVTYVLDGVEVSAADVVGASGELTVTYTLTNLTVEAGEVRYFDGNGVARTAEIDLAVPMGGSVVVLLDANRFADVRAERADVIAGDGAGRTQVQGAWALFAPSGSPVQTFSWSARVTDAVVPPVSIRIVPVVASLTPSGRGSVGLLEQFGGGFTNVANGLGISSTAIAGLRAFIDPTSAGAAQAALVLGQLEGLVASVREGASGGAGAINQNLEILRVQDGRAAAGEGFLYGMLPRADTTMVYAIEVAGLGQDRGPALPIRLGVGIGLLLLVGILGSAVAGRRQA
jgi:hypothetical protein